MKTFRDVQDAVMGKAFRLQNLNARLRTVMDSHLKGKPILDALHGVTQELEELNTDLLSLAGQIEPRSVKKVDS